MATKNIAITEDAYELLTRYKGADESFSEVIREHFTKKAHLLDFAGAWTDMSSDEWKKFEDNVNSVRINMNKSFKRRTKEFNL